MTKPMPHELPESGTYIVVDRLTKVTCMAPTFEGLVARVGQVRSAMGAVSGLDLRAEVERWICEEHPEDCTEVDMTVPRKHQINLTDVLRGTTVMLAKVISGAKPVDRTEAERRAQICLQCEFNQKFPKPCTGVCGQLQEWAIRMSGNQGTQYDRGLQACGICHCFLQAAIWMPLDIQCLGVNEDMRKQFGHLKHCWKQCE